jgi:two-component system chemotaxis response regulator CheY
MAIARAIDVFVVDDMTVSRQLVVNALEQLGIQRVRVENDGRTALAKLKAAPAHLVISDNNMPGLDGLGLLRELRSYPHTKGVGFILVSGTVTAPILEEARRWGLNNFLPKPITPQTLRGSIEAVVGKLQ